MARWVKRIAYQGYLQGLKLRYNQVTLARENEVSRESMRKRTGDEHVRGPVIDYSDEELQTEFAAVERKEL